MRPDNKELKKRKKSKRAHRSISSSDEDCSLIEGLDFKSQNVVGHVCTEQSFVLEDDNLINISDDDPLDRASKAMPTETSHKFSLPQLITEFIGRRTRSVVAQQIEHTVSQMLLPATTTTSTNDISDCESDFVFVDDVK